MNKAASPTCQYCLLMPEACKNCLFFIIMYWDIVYGDVPSVAPPSSAQRKKDPPRSTETPSGSRHRPSPAKSTKGTKLKTSDTKQRSPVDKLSTSSRKPEEIGAKSSQEESSQE